MRLSRLYLCLAVLALLSPLPPAAPMSDGFTGGACRNLLPAAGATAGLTFPAPTQWSALLIDMSTNGWYSGATQNCSFFRPAVGVEADRCGRYRWLSLLPEEICCWCGGGTPLSEPMPPPPPPPPAAPSTCVPFDSPNDIPSHWHLMHADGSGWAVGYRQCDFFAESPASACASYRWQDADPNVLCCECGGGNVLPFPIRPPPLPPSPRPAWPPRPPAPGGASAISLSPPPPMSSPASTAVTSAAPLEGASGSGFEPVDGVYIGVGGAAVVGLAVCGWLLFCRKPAAALADRSASMDETVSRANSWLVSKLLGRHFSPPSTPSAAGQQGGQPAVATATRIDAAAISVRATDSMREGPGAVVNGHPVVAPCSMIDDGVFASSTPHHHHAHHHGGHHHGGHERSHERLPHRRGSSALERARSQSPRMQMHQRSSSRHRGALPGRPPTPPSPSHLPSSHLPRTYSCCSERGQLVEPSGLAPLAHEHLRPTLRRSASECHPQHSGCEEPGGLAVPGLRRSASECHPGRGGGGRYPSAPRLDLTRIAQSIDENPRGDLSMLAAPQPEGLRHEAWHGARHEQHDEEAGQPARSAQQVALYLRGRRRPDSRNRAEDGYDDDDSDSLSSARSITCHKARRGGASAGQLYDAGPASPTSSNVSGYTTGYSAQGFGGDANRGGGRHRRGDRAHRLDLKPLPSSPPRVATSRPNHHLSASFRALSRPRPPASDDGHCDDAASDTGSVYSNVSGRSYASYSSQLGLRLPLPFMKASGRAAGRAKVGIGGGGSGLRLDNHESGGAAGAAGAHAERTSAAAPDLGQLRVSTTSTFDDSVRFEEAEAMRAARLSLDESIRQVRRQKLSRVCGSSAAARPRITAQPFALCPHTSAHCTCNHHIYTPASASASRVPTCCQPLMLAALTVPTVLTARVCLECVLRRRRVRRRCASSAASRSTSRASGSRRPSASTMTPRTSGGARERPHTCSCGGQPSTLARAPQGQPVHTAVHAALLCENRLPLCLPASIAGTTTLARRSCARRARTTARSTRTHPRTARSRIGQTRAGTIRWRRWTRGRRSRRRSHRPSPRRPTPLRTKSGSRPRPRRTTPLGQRRRSRRKAAEPAAPPPPAEAHPATGRPRAWRRRPMIRPTRCRRHTRRRPAAVWPTMRRAAASGCGAQRPALAATRAQAGRAPRARPTPCRGRRCLSTRRARQTRTRRRGRRCGSTRGYEPPRALFNGDATSSAHKGPMRHCCHRISVRRARGCTRSVLEVEAALRWSRREATRRAAAIDGADHRRSRPIGDARC